MEDDSVTSTESRYTLTEETLTPVTSSNDALMVAAGPTIDPAAGEIPVSIGGRKSMKMFVLTR